MTVTGRRAMLGATVLGSLCVVMAVTCAGGAVAASAARSAPALGPAGAAGATGPAAFPVCIEMGGQAAPDIDGNVVVWTDNRDGNLNIYERDVVKKTGFAVCTDPAIQSNPAVGDFAASSGRTEYLAAWVDQRQRAGTSSSIYARNLTTRAPAFPVTNAGNAQTKWFVKVAGTWVVWIQDDAQGGYAVRAKGLGTGTTYAIATTKVLSPLGVSPRTVAGHRVYTVVYASGSGDISACDLPDGTPFTVSKTAQFEWSPDISGNRVVWWASGGKVMLKNIATGRLTVVAAGSRPRIDGALVTWDGGGKGGQFTLSYTSGAAVYVRDVSRAAEAVKITQPHLTSLFPAVSSRWVVWESGPAQRVLSHIHIYGARVTG